MGDDTRVSVSGLQLHDHGADNGVDLLPRRQVFAIGARAANDDTRVVLGSTDVREDGMARSESLVSSSGRRRPCPATFGSG